MSHPQSDYDHSYAISSAIQEEARRMVAQERMAQRLRAAGTPRPRRRFRRAVLALLGTVGLLVLILASGVMFARACGLGASSRTYTVAAIQVGLRHDRAAWLGRTIRVRAVLTACSTWSGAPGASVCVDRRPALLDAMGAATAGPLPLAWGAEHPVLALLRALPVVGGMVPGPQAPVWGVAATYRVRLEVGRCAASGVAPCWRALLLDSGSWETPHSGSGPRSPNGPRAL
jgi:hypothetical protein